MDRDDDALVWLRGRLEDRAMLTSGQEAMYRRAVDRIEQAESILRKLMPDNEDSYQGYFFLGDAHATFDITIDLTPSELAYLRSFE